MNYIPDIAGEISLYDDTDFGMRVETSELYVRRLQRTLSGAGFSCGTHQVKIKGTPKIHNWVEFSVKGRSFEDMWNAIEAMLKDVNVKFVREDFEDSDENHVRFNLIDISMFDKWTS